AQADIYQWEYINPADPSQGKRQSTLLAPDGAGVDAVPGAVLNSRNLTMAYLIHADLTGADGISAILTNADLSRANLTNAFFGGADLTAASLREANLANARFSTLPGPGPCGFEGCYSLAATLTDVDFTKAEIGGADFSKAVNEVFIFGIPMWV